ncbi:hypothetical protein KCG44_06625 [Pacificimonas sp. WHA3]|uniref:Uncharacterized protein n=1 Tax=Pacificimonas pallii TaxID=2827236 RepID=A0ABS6SDK4_9SPHN|nr:hypothetical protein [Pacificimonas pallii]MBV7256459.1 hypothetical protein [Pacificimonas pallii]
MGTYTHIADLITGGWLPYRYAPAGMNAYWTALTCLDPLAILLLWTRRRWGVALTLIIMLSDVPVNLYATLTLWDVPPLENTGLLLQSAFLIFVLGTFRHLRKPDVRWNGRP